MGNPKKERGFEGFAKEGLKASSPWTSGAFNPVSREASNTNGQFTVEDESVHTRYYDAQSLAAQRGMSKGVKVALGAFLVVALTIAAACFMFFRGMITNNENPEQTEINIAAVVDYGFPALQTYALADRDTVLAFLEDSGATYYDRTSEESKASGGLDVIKLADGVDLVTAASWYAQGVSSLSSTDASKLLNGSWQLSMSKTTGYDCRVKYGTFSAANPQEAVNNAVQNFSLQTAPVTDEGVDGRGNTYKEGVVDTDRGTVHWRVSSCPLSEVYKINGLPSSACYVVVRIYQ